MDYLKEILNTAEKRRQYFSEQSLEVDLRGQTIWQYAPNSLLAYFAHRVNELEPELLDWIETLPAQAVFYDLGASTGQYSLYAAMRGLEVCSFEPDALNFSILEVNKFLNQSGIKGSFSTYNLAAADKTSVAEMYTGRFQYGAHNKILGKAEVREGGTFYEPEHIQSVLQLALEDGVTQFGFPAPDFMKIDIDGAELKALSGAGSLLLKVKALFIEVSDSYEDTASVMTLLADAGFREVQRVAVKKPDGGVYPGLYNIIMER